jgi:ribosomal protein L11 methyltransferase
MTDNRLLLKVTCPLHLADLVSEILIQAGSQGVEERDSTTMTASAGAMIELIGGFDSTDERAEAEQSLAGPLFSSEELFVEPMAPTDDDWKIKWREFFKPQILSMLQIVTPWMSPPAGDRIPIVIDPGQAFGTGGHATTRLILEMLEQRARATGLPRRIADIGTGSGILAVAARKLGAAEVVGVDIEEESVAAFFENAKRNGVSDGIDCRLGSAAQLSGTWPLVLANIQIDVFRKIARDTAALVAPGGEVLISGILVEQIQECLSLWPGFKVTERREDGEWAALSLTRNS